MACIRTIVASHVDWNFDDGTRMAADLLLNSIRMVEKHYANKDTDESHQLNKKKISAQLAEDKRNKGSVGTGKNEHIEIELRASKSSHETILSVIEKIGGIDILKGLPKDALKLLLNGYSKDLQKDILNFVNMLRGEANG
ncbi:hypothetical protein [Bdellovibrio reynosensis]|uniref:Uncharacterized protein n=1 Tax=Bdellovibrio reynosensis TaxID=2835041 RepID=A0ABY4CKX0_9BACT|nr:hypothetical protein [Bdellovibrio reynosensis]UOF02890.1 hypothetical protein MNR06_07980 [Bdellovibrio reynosensis]